MRRILAICILITSAWIQHSHAQSPMEDLANDYISQAGTRATELAGLRERLEAGEYATTEDQFMDIRKYLWLEVQMVHLAKMAANLRAGSDIAASNADLASLAELGYLPYWPDNPLNDWEPTQVLSTKDEFEYGALVLELCPSSEYTTLGSTGPIAMSFNLYIYGDDVTAPFDADTWVLKANEGWSSIPAEAIYSQSFHMNSDAERNRARERAEARKVEQEAAEAAKQAEEEASGMENSGE